MAEPVQMVLISSAWTAEHCKVEGGHRYPVSGAGIEYCFALVFGHDLLANAKGWGHVTTDPNKGDDVFGLQSLIMAIDDEEQGAVYIDVDKKYSNNLYNRVIDACARRKLGKAKKEDTVILNKFCTSKRYFNVDHQMDIQAAMEKGFDDDKEEEDEGDMQEYGAKRHRTNGQRCNVYDDPRFQTQYFCGLLGPLYESSDTRLDGVEPYVIVEQDDLDNVDMDIDIEDQNIEEGLEKLLDPNSDIRVLPKARFLVSPVTHKIDPDTLVGYFVRIVQVDPSWNPGKTLKKMMMHRNTRITQSSNRYYKDPYVQYYPLRNSRFPVYHISMEQWTHLRNNICKEEATSDLLLRQYGSESIEAYDHSIHPSKMFTLERALDRLVEAGADAQIWNLNNFKDHTYPQEVEHYNYLPDQIFWYDEHRLGLCEMTFPNVQLNNEALCMLNQLENDPTSTDMLNTLSQLNPVLRREEVLQALPPVVGIPTKNIILLTATEADVTERRVQKAKPAHYEDTLRDHLEGNPVDPILLEEVRRYSQVVDASRDHFMRQFENIFQLESDVTYISIPDTIKVVLRWLQNNFADKSISRNIVKVDSSMSLFGNALSKHLFYLERVLKLLQPIITIKVEGAFGVYARRKGQLLFHYLNYGGRDKGKSYHVIDCGMAQMIPNSYSQELASTDAAYLTDKDYEHVILFMDEVKQYIVDPKAANGKDAKLANIKKATMTSGETHLNVFQLEEIPGTNVKYRSNRKVSSRQNIVEICTSNFAVEKGITSSALVSRYHAESMKSCKAPIEQSNWKVDSKLKVEATNFFCINQAMSCIVEQAMTMNAIVRDPTMDLWHDLSGRILDSLRNMGVVSREEGIRGFSKLSVFARQLVVKMAIHYTYDVPGAPFKGQRYHPRQLETLQRYLYFQSEYAVYLYPLLVSEFIDEDCNIVLRAMCKLLHIEADWDPYEQYTTDETARKQFGKRYNSKHKKDDATSGPQEYVELNYFQIEGDLKSVAQQVAEKTEPHMDPNMVESVLKMLMRRQYTPKRVFLPLDVSTLNTHNKTITQKERLTSANMEMVVMNKSKEIGMDNTAVHQLNRHYENVELSSAFTEQQITRILNSIAITDRRIANMPADKPYEKAVALKLTPYLADMILRMFDANPAPVWEAGTEASYMYVGRNPDGSIPDITDLPLVHDESTQSISVVRYDNAFRGHRKVMFSPEAIHLFNPDVILDALEDAIVCGYTKPFKRLVGFAHKEDMTKFRTANWSKEFIATHCQTYDEAAAAQQINAISRLEGVVFNRRGFTSQKISAMLDSEVAQNANPIELITDIDYESALKHHMKCPNPIDEPVRSPDYIEEAYRAGILRDPVASAKHGTVNYPDDLIAEKKNAEKNFWSNNQAVVLDTTKRAQLRELRKR